jgi:hypothetical protein
LAFGFRVGFSLGDWLVLALALGDALWVALNGLVVTFALVLGPASPASNAKAATAPMMTACRRPWTPMSRLLTTDEPT